VYRIANSADWTFAANVALLQAGWSGSEVYRPIGGAGQDYQWAYAAATIDLVELKAAPSLTELLEEIYKEGEMRASSDGLLKLLDVLFELTGRKHLAQIEWLLQNTIVEKLAPEFAVGILRATANSRRLLPTWPKFRDAVRRELGRRNLNADQILIGLG
jgi:hypothetical protein